MAERMRLDQLLVERGFAPSRARARDAIDRGCVTIAGVPAVKPGQNVLIDDEIVVDDPAQGYVSRAALKLIHALDLFEIDVTDKIALDIGASTGGFTQVLLERSAAHIFAIDVGHDQMAEKIAGNSRVTSREGLNARDLTLDDLDEQEPEFLVCDASFISLKLVLPPALTLAKAGAKGLFLIKPQFEVGKDGIGKRGLLRDPAQADVVAEDLRSWLDSFPDWSAKSLCASPIQGGDGNHEFLLYGEKASSTDAVN